MDRKAELKLKACEQIDKMRDEIIEIGEKILRNPELGFKEFSTSALVSKYFDQFKLNNISYPTKTAVKGWLKGDNSNVNVAVIGELDAVISSCHEFSDPNTGAAHACGHNAQIASMLGCMIGLNSPDIMNDLDGDVCFFAVPAEEYIEMAWRQSEPIKYLGGKQELIHLGAFDDIDMAMMVHAETNTDTPRVVTSGKSLGFIGKNIRFKGKEAHASKPYDGINALNAASLSVSAIHYIRETFHDEDNIRIHPIITKGGDLVNTVPADVRMESYVRASSVDAMKEANFKVDRAIKGATSAIGADVEINNLAGYLPMIQNEVMSKLFSDNAKLLVGEENTLKDIPFSGSTDMGDLSAIMPIIQPTAGGFAGDLHSKDFKIIDKDWAYIIPAKLMAMTCIDLLFDQSKNAKKIISDFKPKALKSEYSNMWDEILSPQGN